MKINAYTFLFFLFTMLYAIFFMNPPIQYLVVFPIDLIFMINLYNNLNYNKTTLYIIDLILLGSFGTAIGTMIGSTLRMYFL